MWYEILPSMGIITAAITFPAIATFYAHKWMQNGNPYRRDLRAHPYDLFLYRRDMDLMGSPYVSKGLEDIPDE